ncbi:MAG: ribosomal-processing cysteine protease Prp [Candidatus Eremiobacteraeota bacterium]|nr:ribosomal-processing cysteine protease Prp [Candidatus Eremiobacteraeota bacterium]MBV9263331.1 ribosomal-processing cysteine protease Prp [Candidatus Eremiobacteraeota bacterium]
MLAVTLYCDARNRIAAIAARGHADFAERGQDIVCAGVSAILQAARLGLEEHAGVTLDVAQRPGSMTLRWPASVRDAEGVRAIVATAALAIEAIARRFPNHVQLHRRPISAKGGKRRGKTGIKLGKR